MSNHFTAPAYEAVADRPVLTLRDGRTFEGKPLSFAAAVRFNKRWRAVSEATELDATFTFASDVLTAMGFPADEVLDALTGQEVFAALASFFGSPTTSSNSESPAAPPS